MCNCHDCRFSEKPEGYFMASGAKYYCIYWAALIGRSVAQKGCDRFMDKGVSQ